MVLPMVRMRALILASHPGPVVAVTAITTLLAAQGAAGTLRLALIALAMLAVQLSVGWSNDARDARRDAATGRTDKPTVRGEITARTLWLAALLALTAGLGVSAALGVRTLIVCALVTAAAWAYNLGLKATVWSGAMYLLAFAGLPWFATSALPGHPTPRLAVTVAAGLLGLGAHFVNVLPDLADDARTGVRGLPQRMAGRYGPVAVRAAALALLLAATVLLLVAASPARRWVAACGLFAACLLAAAGAFGQGRMPFRAAMGIAIVDAVLFVARVETLTPGAHEAR